MLNALKPLYSALNFSEKVNLLLALSVGALSLKYHQKVHKRRRYEYENLASEVLVRTNIWDLELTPNLASKLVFTLAKLRFNNTKYITLPIRDYIF